MLLGLIVMLKVEKITTDLQLELVEKMHVFQIR